MDADGISGEDGGDPGGIPDLDLGEGFGILVPAGTQVCTMSGYADVVQEYRHKGRITLRAGLIRLPRDQEEVEADWIEEIELGPAHARAVPQGPGLFTRALQGTADNGTYHYEFGQAFLVDGQEFDVAFEADFEVVDGAAVDPALVLDLETLSIDPYNGTHRFLLRGLWRDPQSPAGEVRQRYSTCRYDRFDPLEVEIGIQGGDELQMSFRCPDHSQTIVILSTVCPCPLAAASLLLDGQRQDIQDHFRLVFISGNHCNIDQRSLVVLDPPLGGVAAIRVPGGAYSDVAGYPPTQLEYLDADFQTIETRAITSWVDR